MHILFQKQAMELPFCLLVEGACTGVEDAAGLALQSSAGSQAGDVVVNICK
jgi:hypothetical protein